jgi:hypothetical protein
LNEPFLLKIQTEEISRDPDNPGRFFYWIRGPFRDNPGALMLILRAFIVYRCLPDSPSKSGQPVL